MNSKLRNDIKNEIIRLNTGTLYGKPVSLPNWISQNMEKLIDRGVEVSGKNPDASIKRVVFAILDEQGR